MKNNLFIFLVILLLFGSCFLFLKLSPSNNSISASPFLKPIPLQIPRALQNLKVHIEPSGLAWLPSRQRFLTVSDDTPRIKKQKLPWFFDFDLQGKIGYPPILLVGEVRFDDLEGITVDNNEYIYLLCSQSKSHKMRLPLKRQCFIKGHLSFGEFIVNQKTYLRKKLATLFLALNPQARENIFGFYKERDFQRLNLEAITWHQGRLFIGLASPLIQDQKAIIWVVDPEKIFSPVLTPKALKVWRIIDTHGEGISGLCFLSNGDLVLVGGRKQGGSLWIVPKENQEKRVLKPKCIKKWPYNPEGVCHHPRHSDQVVVVFDLGKKPPLWTIVKKVGTGE